MLDVRALANPVSRHSVSALYFCLLLASSLRFREFLSTGTVRSLSMQISVHLFYNTARFISVELIRLL